jgi:hypothetical protein
MTKLDFLMRLSNTQLMEIVRVVEVKGRELSVYYEYVGECLKNSNKMQETALAVKIKGKLIKMV